MSDESLKRITFFTKTPITCRVCETQFFKEELLSGGGRLIAGNLTDELRRSYEPSKKFGELFPLIYTVIVCPACFNAAYPQDFAELKEDTVAKLKEDKERRLKSVSLVLKGLNFAEYRTLKEGAASYYLAMMSYDYFPHHFSPTFKRGLCALRAAWLFGDLHRGGPGENYDYLSQLFYRKARFFYLLALEQAQTGEEPLDSSLNYGPDLDKNYGYEGFLFITGLLDFKYGPRQDAQKRLKALEYTKRVIAKLFGSGRASKSKPSAILEKSKELYEQMSLEIKTLKGEG